MLIWSLSKQNCVLLSFRRTHRDTCMHLCCLPEDFHYIVHSAAPNPDLNMNLFLTWTKSSPSKSPLLTTSFSNCSNKRKTIAIPCCLCLYQQTWLSCLPGQGSEQNRAFLILGFCTQCGWGFLTSCAWLQESGRVVFSSLFELKLQQWEKLTVWGGGWEGLSQCQTMG